MDISLPTVEKGIEVVFLIFNSHKFIILNQIMFEQWIGVGSEITFLLQIKCYSYIE